MRKSYWDYNSFVCNTALFQINLFTPRNPDVLPKLDFLSLRRASRGTHFDTLNYGYFHCIRRMANWTNGRIWQKISLSVCKSNVCVNEAIDVNDTSKSPTGRLSAQSNRPTHTQNKALIRNRFPSGLLNHFHLRDAHAWVENRTDTRG